MARKILDREFRDNLYTEPQTLEDISMLDDVRRTVPYQMAFNGKRWVKDIPRFGFGPRHFISTDITNLSAGTTLPVYETENGTRGVIDGMWFKMDSPDVAIAPVADGIFITDGVGGSPKTGHITFAELWNIGGEITNMKITKYDDTNDIYAGCLTAPISYAEKMRLVVTNTGATAVSGEVRLNWRKIDDRIPRREK